MRIAPLDPAQYRDIVRRALDEDVGAGDINFKGIFARHEQAGIQHFFVEHDEPPDAWASVAASYRYLRGLEF